MDGRRANVVLVGSRHNPKGAVLVLASGSGAQVQTGPLGESVSLVHRGNIIEALCMQERAFGKSGLPAPSESTDTP